MNIFADVISFVHSLISAFVIIVPFLGDIYLVGFNFFFMLLIGFHWIVNNNICALTVIEKIIRQKFDDSETFFGSVFGKVYSIGNDSYVYWAVLIVLILLSMKKIFLHINGKSKLFIVD
jgi:hypothetical protein